MIRKKEKKNFRIEVINLNESYKLDERFLRNLIAKILKLLMRPQNPWLEIIFLSDKAIKDLNKRYKNRDQATDVLSFRLDLPACRQIHTGRRGTEGAGDSAFFGEILISSNTAFRNSKVFKTGFGQELVLYVIHGILHLFGYDDKKQEDRRGMREKEQELLSRLCRSGDLSRVSMTR